MPKRATQSGGEGRGGLCGSREAHDAFTPPHDPPEGGVARMSARGMRSSRRTEAPRVEEQVLDGPVVTQTKRKRVSTSPIRERRAGDVEGSARLTVDHVSKRVLTSSSPIKASKDWEVDTIMFRKLYPYAGKVIHGESWYGCANIPPGVESYYRMIPTSFNICDKHTRATSFPTKMSIPKTEAFPGSVVIPGVRITRIGLQKCGR